MTRRLHLVALFTLLFSILTPTAHATTPPPTPHIFAVYPGQAMPADWTQDSTWIGVVFSDAGYTGARLNLYLTGSPNCLDFNKSPVWFWFDTTGQNGTGYGSSYWWSWHASSYGATGKANCNRSRAWSARHTNQYQDGGPASIANFGVANDNLEGMQIGRIG